MRELEWDEAKRIANLAKHDFDFSDAHLFFDGRPTIENSSDRDGEPRFAVTAEIYGRYYTMVWTPRGDRARVISIRRARRAERRRYSDLHAG